MHWVLILTHHGHTCTQTNRTPLLCDLAQDWSLTAAQCAGRAELTVKVPRRNGSDWARRKQADNGRFVLAPPWPWGGFSSPPAAVFPSRGTTDGGQRSSQGQMASSSSLPVCNSDTSSVTSPRLHIAWALPMNLVHSFSLTRVSRSNRRYTAFTGCDGCSCFSAQSSGRTIELSLPLSALPHKWNITPPWMVAITAHS